MSLHILTTGSLISDPARRTSATGTNYAIGTIRVSTDDGPILVSLIAFGDRADELLAHQHGSQLAVSGRAKLTQWTGKDGAAKVGLAVVAEQIASAGSARRAEAARRRDRHDAA